MNYYEVSGILRPTWHVHADRLVIMASGATYFYITLAAPRTPLLVGIADTSETVRLKRVTVRP